MSKTVRAVCWCALIAALSGVRPAGAQEVDYTVTADVVYGHKDGMALTYDVLRPVQPNGAGVVYMVSGGWFSRWAPPARTAAQHAALLEAGFTVFAVRHGSAPRYKVPEATADVRLALRHVRRHAADFGVDPERLGVFGGSAGGHLSLMLGLDPAAETTDTNGGGEMEDRVAAVVAYYPPVDIRPIVGPSERFPALDFADSLAASISPILFVTGDDPPTLLIHGDADRLVPIRNSQILHDALQDAGVESDFVTIPGGDHGFTVPEHRARAAAAMVDWFRRHLGRGPS